MSLPICSPHATHSEHRVLCRVGWYKVDDVKECDVKVHPDTQDNIQCGQRVTDANCPVHGDLRYINTIANWLRSLGIYG